MAWWSKQLAVLAVLAGVIALGKTAQAETPPASNWLDAKVNESGQHCEKHAEQRDANRLLVACGTAGVWEFALDEAAPRLVRSYGFSGDVVGFFTEADGRLWVKVQVLEARPFAPSGAVRFPDPAPSPSTPGAETAPRQPDTATPPPPPPPARTVVVGPHPRRVTRSMPGEVVVSLGAMDGVMRGDHIELALEQAEDAAGDGVALNREALAIGLVTNVTEQSARVRLGLNESVPIGALATPTRSPLTSSLSAPPRVSDVWTLELMARPFAALGELGGGALISGAFGRRLGHLHLQGVVDPLAFGDVQSKNAIGAANTALIASYDSQYFEMGLGFGVQTVNSTDFFVAPGSGLAALQLIRLGARDGLNISARTNIVLFHSQFQFGGMIASGQIPVTRGYWLLLNGGGGSIGYAYGEFGLRVLLDGDGLAGSKYLTVTAGGAAVFRTGVCPLSEPCQDSAAYGGPMAGIGGEWRF